MDIDTIERAIIDHLEAAGLTPELSTDGTNEYELDLLDFRDEPLNITKLAVAIARALTNEPAPAASSEFARTLAQYKKLRADLSSLLRGEVGGLPRRSEAEPGGDDASEASA